MIERSGGTISLKLLTASISKVQIGTDKTAAELAIRRLKEEIDILQTSYYRLIKKQNNEIGQNTTFFLLAGGTVFLFVLLGLVPSSPVLGLFCGLVTIAGFGFFGYKRLDNIKAKYKPQIGEIDQKHNLVSNRMAQNKAIVDN